MTTAPHSSATKPQRHLAVAGDTPYDLEFRSTVDDGWYTALIVNDGDTLAVKLLDFPEWPDERFELTDLETVDDVDAVVERFRPISKQLQDSECSRVEEGTGVCASRTFAVGDVRYYDAVVESVHRKEHLFEKEEECKCEFMLCWQHGPVKGHISIVNIVNICMIQPFTELDSRVASFSKMAKKKVKSSAISDLVSVGEASSPGNETTLLLTNKCSSSSEHTIQDKQEGTQCPSFFGTREESVRIIKFKEYTREDIDFTVAGRVSKYHEDNLQVIGGSLSTGGNVSLSSIDENAKKHLSLSRRELQDKDVQFLGSPGGKEGITECFDNNLQLIDSGDLLGPKKSPFLSSLRKTAKKFNSSSRNGLQDEERVGREFLSPAGKTAGFSSSEESESYHFILIDNLEKDLSSSSILKFIQKHTAISPQAYVFPSLSSEAYARGVIATDCEKKLKEIHKFLHNPDHIVTSSKGRPWFVHEEPLRCKTFETTIRGGTPIVQEKASVEELKVVHREEQPYNAAKRKRDVFFEYIEHQNGLHKKLAFEEKNISQMVDSAGNWSRSSQRVDTFRP